MNNLRLTWCSITVRQTRNHLAADVQYIASKRAIIPNPLEIEAVSLSALGFVNYKQKLVVHIISPL